MMKGQTMKGAILGQARATVSKKPNSEQKEGGLQEDRT